MMVSNIIMIVLLLLPIHQHAVIALQINARKLQDGDVVLLDVFNAVVRNATRVIHLIGNRLLHCT
jgi:hypothetical protein